jgi:invasion protein IalB
MVHFGATLLLAYTTSAAFAQQSPPAPGPKSAPNAAINAAGKAAPRTARKAGPKGKSKQQPASQAQPAQPRPQRQGRAPNEQQTSVIYSPWTKFCGKDQNRAGTKQVWLTVKEARLETGQFLAGAALFEQEGEQKKLFRITLPLGMQLPRGTRVIVDQDQPISGRYIVCLPNGCLADFEVNPDFLGRLKKGQKIVLQGINLSGQLASYPIPLTDFAEANEGPPTDPKVVGQQQRKLQEALERRAEEARKQLERRNAASSAAVPSR